jgi:pyruvate,water dikinase
MREIHNENWLVACGSPEPVIGRIIIIRSQADLSRVSKGDILITKQTDVNYIPQMLIATAIITENGGRFSHAATFCRERKIPCLTGLDGIMSVLVDGGTITIDTKTKTIIVHT